MDQRTTIAGYKMNPYGVVNGTNVLYKSWQSSKFKESKAEYKIRKAIETFHYVNFIQEANIGQTYFYDFLFPDHMVIIEYDGEEFHNSLTALIRDNTKDELAKEKGFTLYRLRKCHWSKLELHIARILLKHSTPKVLPIKEPHPGTKRIKKPQKMVAVNFESLTNPALKG